jgi:integrase
MAAEVELMLRRLAGTREWELLAAAVSSPDGVGKLFDAWQSGPDAIAEHKARINDLDLNELVDQWQEWVKRNAGPTTASRYLVQLRALMPANQPHLRSQFTRTQINRALAELPVKGSTARRYHAAWSSFGRYLVEMEKIEFNPLASVTRPRNNPPKELYLSLHNVKRLVDARSEPYRSLAALREGAGVEISAALKVTKGAIDFETRTIHVHGTKNSWRDRPVYAEEWAWPYIVKAAKGKFADSPLFADQDGNPATYYGARVSHEAARTALKLPSGYTMHDARHSFAVRAMKAKVDPQHIASNLGHRDASLVLKVYGKHRITAEDFKQLRTGTAGT